MDESGTHTFTCILQTRMEPVFLKLHIRAVVAVIVW